MNTNTTAPDPAVEAMELVWVDPAEVVIEGNVRDVVDLDPAFVSSIREHGVLQPPTGWRDESGGLHVEIGQQRVLAAATVGVRLPVIVKSRADAEAERIAQQLVENDRRKPLTEAQRAAAYQQMTLFGWKSDEIAKRTGEKRESVRKAVKVIKEEPRVLEVMRQYPVTLDVAAQLTEFTAHPDIVERLTETAESWPARLPHEIAEAREEVAMLAELKVLRAESLTEFPGASFVGIDAEWEDWCDRLELPDGVEFEEYFPPLAELRIGDSAEAPTPEEAHTQGGLVIVAEELAYHQRRLPENEGKQLDRTFHVLNPLEHGYRLLTDEDQPEPSPEELERRERIAARDAREAEEREAWQRATTVRHEWLRDTLLHDRRKLPAGAGRVILDGWLRGGGVLPRFSQSHISGPLGARLLGLTGEAAELPTPGYYASPDQLVGVQKLRDLAEGLGHERVLLALTLGTVESDVSTDRGPSRKWAQYFELLESWGYGLAEIERRTIELRDEHAAAEAEAAAAAADAGEEE